ncbi:MAG: hypothetical protein ACI8RD_007704, partial [Bacillariaceae sp.]
SSKTPKPLTTPLKSIKAQHKKRRKKERVDARSPTMHDRKAKN